MDNQVWSSEQIILAYNGGRYYPEMLDSLFDIRMCLERTLVELRKKNSMTLYLCLNIMQT
jgi:hypothetical protein